MAKKAWAALVVLLASAFAGEAPANVSEVKASIEASMLVTGTIEVDPQGRVAGFEIDHRDKLPAHARELVDASVPGWRFEPTQADGQPAWVRTPMRLRLVATRVPGAEGSVALRIESASFGEPSGFAGRIRPPTYPIEALKRGASGSVFLVLKVDREGRVEDVVTEQVNLRYLASGREMERIRGMFSRAAEQAARRWNFAAPAGADADSPFWTARVPVDFNIGTQGEPPYGAWASYVPGPRQEAPWLDAQAPGGDAYAAGGVYPVGTGLKLLTRLGVEG